MNLSLLNNETMTRDGFYFISDEEDARIKVECKEALWKGSKWIAYWHGDDEIESIKARYEYHGDKVGESRLIRAFGEKDYAAADALETELGYE